MWFVPSLAGTPVCLVGHEGVRRSGVWNCTQGTNHIHPRKPWYIFFLFCRNNNHHVLLVLYIKCYCKNSAWECKKECVQMEVSVHSCSKPVLVTVTPTLLFWTVIVPMRSVLLSLDWLSPHQWLSLCWMIAVLQPSRGSGRSPVMILTQELVRGEITLTAGKAVLVLWPPTASRLPLMPTATDLISGMSRRVSRLMCD